MPANTFLLIAALISAPPSLMAAGAFLRWLSRRRNRQLGRKVRLHLHRRRVLRALASHQGDRLTCP